MFGGAPATQQTAGAGGFGGGGGFGSAQTATTTTGTGFGGAAPAATTSTALGGGGFGAPTAATGGFGGFGGTQTAQPATGGFGAAAQPSTGFGGGGGFGAKPAVTVGGWGTTSTAGQGFGSTGGFGTTGGFGNTTATTQGFGVQSGFSQPVQQQPQQPQVTLRDYNRQSALASYLMELDNAYNALSPKCRFLTFAYNRCAPGQVVDAIQKQRYIAHVNGGGCSEEDWMQAQHRNPDPTHLYPVAVHFMQEVQKRTEKQKEATQQLSKHVGELLEDVEAIVALNAANSAQLRELKQDAVMLRRRWYAVLRKTESLRLRGTPCGEESLLAQRVDVLRQQLASSGQFRSALGELQPFVEAETSRAAMAAARASPRREGSASTDGGRDWQLAPSTAADAASDSAGGGAGALVPEVDPLVMRGWLQIAEQTQHAIESLAELLETDGKDMKAIRERVSTR